VGLAAGFIQFPVLYHAVTMELFTLKQATDKLYVSYNCMPDAGFADVFSRLNRSGGDIGFIDC
jgi:hypothetical protein